MSKMHHRQLLMGLMIWAMAGCHLIRFEAKEENSLPSVSESLRSSKAELSQLEGPRRVGMRIATVIAPFQDVSMDSSIWRTADEQIISTDQRKLLRSNGIRIGLLRSSLPSDIEELLKRSGPAGQSVEPLVVNQPINEPVKISTTDARTKALIKLANEEKANEKTFNDAKGFIRASAMTDNQSGVLMKITPELHHGSIRTQFKPATETQSVFEPAQLSIQTGQTEEMFQELSTRIRVEEGECLVIGLDSEQENSLGWFMLTDPPTSEREMQQKMVLIWAWNTNRDTSLNVPSIVQNNSLEHKDFQPLQSPPPSGREILADRNSKNRDRAVEQAGYVSKTEALKPADSPK
jgi:hypothetical protein